MEMAGPDGPATPPDTTKLPVLNRRAIAGRHAGTNLVPSGVLFNNLLGRVLIGLLPRGRIPIDLDGNP